MQKTYSPQELKSIILVDGPDIVQAADCVDDTDIEKQARELKRDIDDVRNQKDLPHSKLRVIIFDLADLAVALDADENDPNLAGLFDVAAQYRADHAYAEQRRTLKARQLKLKLTF